MMNTHKKWCPWILDLFVAIIFPFWNIFTPLAPKHNNILDSSFLVNPTLSSKCIHKDFNEVVKTNLSTNLSTHTQRGTMVKKSITYAMTHIHDLSQLSLGWKNVTTKFQSYNHPHLFHHKHGHITYNILMTNMFC
jgi:hypothetical protein